MSVKLPFKLKRTDIQSLKADKNPQTQEAKQSHCKMQRMD